ncbi:MAG TPA: DJ-1/PfpI family protein [Candidatus Altiarchaeales archaeon]|nr:DJ-1/PfpI family protein [Candidatus Altiarchaeales archaeon]
MEINVRLRKRRYVAISLIALLLFVCCVNFGRVSSPEIRSVDKKLSGKHILVVIAPKNFRDEEYSIPRKLFEEMGAEVTVASTSKETAVGMLGLKVKPDLTLAEVDPDKYDAIVIVGGTGSRQYLWNNEKLIAIVQKMYAKHKVIAAICLSPVVLSQAGILNGKNSTVFPDKEAINLLRKGNSTFIDEGVVVDGNIITSQSPKFAYEFGEKVAEKLSQ